MIWLCETESVQDPEKNGSMPPKDPLTDIAVAMRTRLCAQMSDAQRAFFEAEFRFFEAVTAISGVLKPLPDKPTRKVSVCECGCVCLCVRRRMRLRMVDFVYA